MVKFMVRTPLGFSVRTTESYWSLLMMEHPEILGRENDVKQTLAKPHLICRSRHDKQVYLFYQVEGSYYLCVVARRLDGDGFILTAYVTDSVKEGAQVWPTSV